MKLREKRRVHHPPMDELRGVRADIFRASGLRADFNALTAEEAVELRALTIEARNATRAGGIDACDPARLTVKDRGRWEKLVEQSAGEPGWLAKQRAQEKTERDQAAKAKKPARQQRWEQPGVIVLPASILAGLQQRGIGAVHLLVLTVVLAAIENKCALHDYMRVDDDGSIVVDAVENLVRPFDPHGDVSHVGQAVQELADTGVLIIEKQGFVRVRLGALLTAALANRGRAA